MARRFRDHVPADGQVIREEVGALGSKGHLSILALARVCK
jgi:hypothetical protein